MKDLDARSFFHPGGALPLDAPSYVERQADSDLYNCLIRQEYCSILTSRQMGKSSLIARTAVRLRSAGVAVCVIDLNRIGIRDQTSESWYYSLLLSAAKGLGRSKRDVDDYWRTCTLPTPMQKWIAGIEEVLLQGELEAGRSGLILFIDEIDQVREADYKNEFFAAIRSCYNNRSAESSFKSITFCLVGSALATDLIADPHLTPFNVGRHIELTDFTESEAQKLVPGMARGDTEGKNLLKRVLHWTGGHPYLTHRLCLAIAESPAVISTDHVDALTHALFLSVGGREQDDNLAFARHRLLLSMKSEKDVAALLTQYGKVRAGRRVRDSKSDPACGVLHLSGVVRSEAGFLQVRNRIYAAVFDRAWIRENMPGAERRRVRKAFFRGLVTSGSVVVVVAGLGLNAWRLSQIATATATESAHLKYVTNLELMPQLWEHSDLELMETLLQQALPKDRLNFEWRYWLRQLHLDAFTVEPWKHGGQNSKGKEVAAVAVSPRGGWFATSGRGDCICLWNADGTLKQTLKTDESYSLSLDISPDEKWLVAGGGDGNVRIWNLHTLESTTSPPGVARFGQINCVRFSPDGSSIAAARTNEGNGGVTILSARDLAKWRPLPSGFGGETYAVAFSPKASIIAASGEGGMVRLLNLNTGKPVGPVLHGSKVIGEEALSTDCLAFSPNGTRLAAGSKDWMIRLWDVDDPTATTLSRTLKGSQGWVSSIAFTRDGQQLLSTGTDRAVRVWNLSSGGQDRAFPTHRRWVNCLALDEGHNRVYTASDDGTARAWGISSRSIPVGTGCQGLAAIPNSAKCVVLTPTELLLLDSRTAKTEHLLTVSPMDRLTWTSPTVSLDGRRVGLLGGDGSVEVYDLATGARTSFQLTHETPIGNGAFSPDLTRIITVGVAGQGSGGSPVFETELAKPGLSRPARVLEHANTIRVAWGASDSQAWYDKVSLTLKVGSVSKVRHHISPSQTNPGNIWLSPNGQALILVEDQKVGLVQVYSTNPLQKVQELMSPGRDLGAVAFPPDADRAATCSLDGTVKIWDLTTGRDVLTSYSGTGTSVPKFLAFTDRGNRLVSASANGDVTVLTAATSEEVVRWTQGWRSGN